MYEVKKPHVTKKINDALRQIPGLTIEQAKELVAPLCLTYEIFESGSRNSNLFRRNTHKLENWCEGYVFGTGARVAIVSGSFAQDKLQTGYGHSYFVVCVVREEGDFIKALQEISAVMMVQVA